MMHHHVHTYVAELCIIKGEKEEEKAVFPSRECFRPLTHPRTFLAMWSVACWPLTLIHQTSFLP